MFPMAYFWIPTKNNTPILPPKDSLLDGLPSSSTFLPAEQVPWRHDSQKQTPERGITRLPLTHCLAEVVHLGTMGVPRQLLQPPIAFCQLVILFSIPRTALLNRKDYAVREDRPYCPGPARARSPLG